MQPAMRVSVSNYPNQLYSSRNSKLPRAVEMAADNICELPNPTVKDLPLLVELSVEFVEFVEFVELDVLLSLLTPESTWLNWLMTKDVASSR